MANKNFIKKAIKNPGALTKKAKESGKTVSGIIKNPSKNASLKTKKQITLAKTLKKIHKNTKATGKVKSVTSGIKIDKKKTMMPDVEMADMMEKRFRARKMMGKASHYSKV